MGPKRRAVLEAAEYGHLGLERFLGTVSSPLYLSLSLRGLSMSPTLQKGSQSPSVGLTCLEEVVSWGGATLSQGSKGVQFTKQVGRGEAGRGALRRSALA